MFLGETVKPLQRPTDGVLEGFKRRSCMAAARHCGGSLLFPSHRRATFTGLVCWCVRDLRRNRGHVAWGEHEHASSWQGVITSTGSQPLNIPMIQAGRG